MALWRREANERLPELKQEIDTADSVMSLWIEIGFAFEDAYRKEPRDEALIARIYAFADWCVRARRNDNPPYDPLSAVATCFYEKIPTIKLAREDMPRWFTYSDVVEMRRTFSYMIGDEAYEALLVHMKQQRNRYVIRRT